MGIFIRGEGHRKSQKQNLRGPLALHFSGSASPSGCGEKYPPPPCFAQRAREWLKTKALAFRAVQKSAQEFEKKELDLLSSDDRRTARSRMGIVGTHAAIFVRVARKGLRGYGK